MLDRFLVTLLLVSCTILKAEDLTVAAAADLAAVEARLDQGFFETAGTHVRFTTGASGMLAKQIENGAPFDVFLSANVQYVKDLTGSGKLDSNAQVIYARGRLGLWSKDGKIRKLTQLLEPGVTRISIANPAHAPYGVAAREILERQDMWKKLQPKIVFGENVRQTLQYAESGNVNATITAWSLLFDKGGVLLPEDHHPIAQAAAMVAATKHPREARQFIEFLVSPAARKIFKSSGFEVEAAAGSPP
jgi:molybdate transport system substrate-binding protein